MSSASDYEALQQLSQRFFAHPDVGGDYLSMQELYSLIHLQRAEIESLNKWVADCQAEMYVNCVYCGHRYGPRVTTDSSQQQMLYDHIAVCPKHPLRKALLERDEARKAARVFYRRSQGLGTHQRLAMKELYPWLEEEK